MLDIDDLYARMQARGVAMIDEIQGPPGWAGPDVLLRQTSFRALAEDRWFRHPDGAVRRGSLRVRFGEVEQRGIALTAAGRDVYDRLVAEVDERLAAPEEDRPRADVAREVWEAGMPRSERELAARGLAFFTYRVDPAAPPADTGDLARLVAAGILVPEPIVYEDFLPRSAAGIFRSNLTDEGSRDDAQAGTAYDIGALAEILGRTVHDPVDLYAAQRDASIRRAEAALGRPLSGVPG